MWTTNMKLTMYCPRCRVNVGQSRPQGLHTIKACITLLLQAVSTVLVVFSAALFLFAIFVVMLKQKECTLWWWRHKDCSPKCKYKWTRAHRLFKVCSLHTRGSTGLCLWRPTTVCWQPSQPSWFVYDDWNVIFEFWLRSRLSTCHSFHEIQKAVCSTFWCMNGSSDKINHFKTVVKQLFHWTTKPDHKLVCQGSSWKV